MNHDEKAESYVPDKSESLSVVSDSLRPYGLHSSWNSPGQNTGVGSISLLQGIFPIQGSNPGLLNCRQILYQLSHQGSPRILEWVAYLFSSGSSWPRNQTWGLQMQGSPAFQADCVSTELSGQYAVYVCHNFSSNEQASFNFMAAVTIYCDFGAKENKVCHCFPILLQWVMGPDVIILVFWMLSLKPTFLLSSFTFIKRLFSSSLFFAIRVGSSAYLRLLIFLLEIFFFCKLIHFL